MAVHYAIYEKGTMQKQSARARKNFPYRVEAIYPVFCVNGCWETQRDEAVKWSLDRCQDDFHVSIPFEKSGDTVLVRYRFKNADDAAIFERVMGGRREVFYLIE